MLSNAVLHFLGFGATTAAKKILDNNGDCFPSWLKPYNNVKCQNHDLHKEEYHGNYTKVLFFPSLCKIIMNSYSTRLHYEVWKWPERQFPITCYQKHFLKWKTCRMIAQGNNAYFNRKANEQTKHFLWRKLFT